MLGPPGPKARSEALMDWRKKIFDNNENAGKAAQIITDRREDAPECTDRKKHPWPEIPNALSVAA